MGNAVKFLAGQFSFSLGNLSFSVPYIEVAALVFLIFLLIVTMAQLRRHNIDWSIKGIVFGTFFGFLLALTLEGFLITKGGTALTGILGWKNAPAPISIALDAGRNKLIQVLGASDKITTPTTIQNSTVTGAVQFLQNLSPGDIKKVKTIFCQQ
ncbi:MAG TPA: hypothetical protein VMR19_03160 [Candidatus Saccharimonadales bacterium]|jgi:hypothetical protein|nr:hypothetical protein [Candidatus Saccharimonadales bacterium]